MPPAHAASPRQNRPSSVDGNRLRYMAEQIARNFAAQGDVRAIAATAEHIRLYWDPRMKAAILADDRATMSPVVAAAVAALAGV